MGHWHQPAAHLDMYTEKLVDQRLMCKGIQFLYSLGCLDVCVCVHTAPRRPAPTAWGRTTHARLKDTRAWC